MPHPNPARTFKCYCGRRVRTHNPHQVYCSQECRKLVAKMRVQPNAH